MDSVNRRNSIELEISDNSEIDDIEVNLTKELNDVNKQTNSNKEELPLNEAEKIIKRKTKLIQEGRDFECNICDRSYFSKNAMIKHKQLKHLNNNNTVDEVQQSVIIEQQEKETEDKKNSIKKVIKKDKNEEEKLLNKKRSKKDLLNSTVELKLPSKEKEIKEEYPQLTNPNRPDNYRIKRFYMSKIRKLSQSKKDNNDNEDKSETKEIVRKTKENRIEFIMTLLDKFDNDLFKYIETYINSLNFKLKIERDIKEKIIYYVKNFTGKRSQENKREITKSICNCYLDPLDNNIIKQLVCLFISFLLGRNLKEDQIYLSIKISIPLITFYSEAISQKSITINEIPKEANKLISFYKINNYFGNNKNEEKLMLLDILFIFYDFLFSCNLTEYSMKYLTEVELENRNVNLSKIY